MKCMLFKSRKKLIIEFIRTEWRYLDLYCKYHGFSEEDSIHYCYTNDTNMEVLDIMSKRQIINKIKKYNRDANIYENYLAGNKK